MSRLLTLCILALISQFLLVQKVNAQLDPIHQQINNWFQEERFLIADQNDDALLDQSEMERFENEFSYFLVDRHYELTDQNQDGFISFYELQDRSHSEKLYRYNTERKSLRELSMEHPLLSQADARYLKQNPELVAQLFGNFVWLSENRELAESIYTDRLWTGNHPEVMVALHRNLRWMAANPSDAEKLYRNRSATQYLPELLSWRADHKDFIRQHPRLDDFYRSAFYPGGLGVRR